LKLAGFYRDPFYLKAEQVVNILSQDRDILVQGRIDVLVFNPPFWVVVIEAKRQEVDPFNLGRSTKGNQTSYRRDAGSALGRVDPGPRPAAASLSRNSRARMGSAHCPGVFVGTRLENSLFFPNPNSLTAARSAVSSARVQKVYLDLRPVGLGP
jgi:hypothetical protein